MARRRNQRARNNEILILVLALALAGSFAGFKVHFGGNLLVLAAVLTVIGVGAVTGYVVLTLQRQRAHQQALRELNIDNVDQMSGVEFEKYVGAMLGRRGFKQVNYTTLSNDNGIDITAVKDGKRFAVQTKRYSAKVTKAHVFPITSARDNLGFDHAMLVTNNYFTSGAIEYAKLSRCVLVDRDTLADWRSPGSETSASSQ